METVLGEKAMSYGLQILNSAGATILDTSKYTWNYINHGYGGSGTTISIPNKYAYTEFLLVTQHGNTNPLSQETTLPQVSISGDSVLLSGGNVAALVTVLGR